MPRDIIPHTVVAHRVLGPCTCSVEYTSRNLIAPDCVWHDCHEELEEALEEAYQRGLKMRRLVREETNG